MIIEPSVFQFLEVGRGSTSENSLLVDQSLLSGANETLPSTKSATGLSRFHLSRITHKKSVGVEEIRIDAIGRNELKKLYFLVRL